MARFMFLFRRLKNYLAIILFKLKTKPVIMKIQQLVGGESLRRRDSEEYKAMLANYGIE